MTLRLGLVFSTTGSYGALGQSALAGALGAIERLARHGAAPITPVIADPGGDLAAYERMTREMLESGVRHIVGAITSWSRKEMIPLLERHGGLLWYPCPYEGFESNDHVVYLGASPNHHVVPVADWIAAQGLRRAFLVGSNYVWGWETLRLARECLMDRGIEVVGERHVPLGADTPAHIFNEIRDQQADCVIDSLIGPSNTSFLLGLAARRTSDCPPVRVVSFNQTEADLAEIGPAADGLLSAGSFFETNADEALRDVARRHAPNGRVSSFFATSFAAVEIISAAVARAGSDSPPAVFRAATDGPVSTVMGPMPIDPVLRHAMLTPRLAIACKGQFDVVQCAGAPVAADPYMTARSARRPAPAAQAQRRLRVVK
ncbi:aliphatic amidase expression-regulating protein [Roseovarius sp. A-2]|uniref:transporter substrate-binding protein n=1 Tax=Roseovarius sp. A-2 TaxID=1570360 RepID=UPI0009CF03CD|nr:transporter substrate-binding protein [Roseovarius sp. A-2]GAW34462.1 aliphatic amidase expression-regulating protein [Roseovarius sp. A-2]